MMENPGETVQLPADLEGAVVLGPQAEFSAGVNPFWVPWRWVRHGEAE